MNINKEEFKKYATEYNVLVVFKEIIADMHTPVSVFTKVEEQYGEACLLESAENIDKWGRYSFIASKPKAIFKMSDGNGILEFENGKKIESESKDKLGAFDPLRNYIHSRNVLPMKDLPEFFGGAIGFFSYECVNLFEKLPEPKGDRVFDDARFCLYDNVIIFDNLRHTAKIVSCIHTDEFENLDIAYEQATKNIEETLKIFYAPSKLRTNIDKAEKVKIDLKSNFEREAFIDCIEKAKEYIRTGEAIQIVPSQKFTSDINLDPINIYRALRQINPSPYMFFLKFEGKYILGSSPETLLKFKDNTAQLRPIAGTRKRGIDEIEDMKNANELLSDPKERAEHLMLVDLGRNDLSKFCEAGSVQVNDFMIIERYSHVMHIVSNVSGIAMKGVDAFDALEASFPAGTLTGAPKIRAMQIINELEPQRRGPYGGAIGYISYQGDMDLAITIRTLQIADKKMSVQAGAGIVFDSDANSEFEETKIKAGAIKRALELAVEIEKGNI